MRYEILTVKADGIHVSRSDEIPKASEVQGVWAVCRDAELGVAYELNPKKQMWYVSEYQSPRSGLLHKRP